MAGRLSVDKSPAEIIGQPGYIIAQVCKRKKDITNE